MRAMSRWKASAIHFCLSLVVASLIALALCLVWYPPPLFQASGLDTFMFILVGVDVTIGPLLTLVVFKAGKPGMRFDLSMIALAQTAALGYGLLVMWEARPVYLVAAVDRIEVVTANSLDPEFLAAAGDSEYVKLPAFGARLVGIELPAAGSDRSRLLEEVLAGKPDVSYRPQYYVPYETASRSLVRKARPVSQLIAADPQLETQVSRIADTQRMSIADLVFVPVRAPVRSVCALLDRRSGQLIAMVDANPWIAINDASPANGRNNI